MSRPDPKASLPREARLPRLPCDEGLPVFAEPLQAQAFALAVRLSEQGHFSWAEWVEVFSDELLKAKVRCEPNDNSGYYLCWLAALECLVVSRGLSDLVELETRKDAWADAYCHTPHGQSVELRN